MGRQDSQMARLIRFSLVSGVLLLVVYWLFDWLDELGRTAWLIERARSAALGDLRGVVDIVIFNLVLYVCFALVSLAFGWLIYRIGARRR